MPKYNVGVGDAFPLDQTDRDQADRRPEPEGNDDRDAIRRRRRGDYYRWGRSAFLFEVSLILVAIWGVLHYVNGYGPRGLLIAAGITFAVAVVRRLFWRSYRARREWYDERRRNRWRDR